MKVRNNYFFSAFPSVATISRTNRHGMGVRRRPTVTPQLDQPAALRYSCDEQGGEA